MLCLGLLALTRSARAEPPERRDNQRAIGFSRLAERTARDTPVHFEQEAFRVFILEHLRKLGLHAVGGEEDLFGRSLEVPELVLGGVVREFLCNQINRTYHCRFGLNWQVLDVHSGQVIYEATVRGAVYDIQSQTSGTTVGKQMLTLALDSLLRRPRFTKLLEPHAAESDATFPVAGFRRCTSGALDMPRQAPKATEATVVIESKGGTGSGFFLNDEGLILTAAHVVSDTPEPRARLQDGQTFPLDVIRSSRSADFALVRVRGGLKSRCLELSPSEATLGADVYAIGAPSGGQLAFSLTRGIVSGLRQWQHGALLQTDAAISPGNSGGPLLGSDGRVKAIVSRKVVGAAIEGLAFGVPVATGLLALGLEPATTSAPQLSEAATSTPASDVPLKPFVDQADPVPSLDPVGDAQRAYVARLRAQEQAQSAANQQRQSDEARTVEQNGQREREEAARLSPGYIQAMRWSGLALAGAGLITAVATAASYDRSTSTKQEYESLRLWNDIGFVALGVGAASFGASFLVSPRSPNGNTDPHAPGHGSTAWVQVRGSY